MGNTRIDFLLFPYREKRKNADKLPMISDIPKQILIAIMGIAAALTAYLLASIIREERPEKKFTSFLFLVLYSSLLLSLFVKTESHPLFLFNIGLIMIGFIYFYGGLVASLLRRGSTPSVIQELRRGRGPLYEISKACAMISEARMGALILLERKKSLTHWTAKGILVDARISRELIVSIFTPPGALHDGAMLVQKDRILCAGVIVPLSKNPNLSKELGTRHRAAIGFSEITDALCIIISEETGAISLADKGKLFYDIPAEKLAYVLERAYRFKTNKVKNLALYTEPVKV